MKKFMFLFLLFMFIAGLKYAYCQDNLLAVDVPANKQNAAVEPDKAPAKTENTDKAPAVTEDEALPKEETEQELNKIRAYRELLDNKQKELELIRIDLEKSNLLLKKKEAERDIFQIDKGLPEGKQEVSIPGQTIQSTGVSPVDTSDMKIQYLVIADNLKEGQITLKGVPYSFKEGDCVASKLTVQKIDSDSVTFKQADGSVLKLDFIN